MRLITGTHSHGMPYEVGCPIGLPEARDPVVAAIVQRRRATELIRFVAREEGRTPLDVTAAYRLMVVGPLALQEDEDGQPLPLDDPRVTVWVWHLRLDPRGGD